MKLRKVKSEQADFNLNFRVDYFSNGEINFQKSYEETNLWPDVRIRRENEPELWEYKTPKSLSGER